AEVRRNAANALAKFGSLAKDAVPTLTARADDKDTRVRTAARAALKTILKATETASKP
ncbi:HEAT repeat domain-containing protein, partial [Singulisphaera rosea]